jgi:hypothetical protein
VRFAERQVRPDADAGTFLPLGDDLEQELGAAGVDLDVAEFGSQAVSERAFRLLRWFGNRPEPPAPN